MSPYSGAGPLLGRPAVSRMSGLLVGLLMGLAFVACDDPADVGVAPEDAEFVDPVGSAVVGSELDVAVRVLDEGDDPIAGHEVAWTVTSGDGELSAPTSSTGSDGVATVTWTLGEDIGEQTVRATPADVDPVDLTVQAVAGPAAILTPQEYPDSAEVFADVEIAIQVEDSFGNAVAGAAVTFSPAEGSGSVDPAVAETGADGGVLAVWTLGEEPGAQRVVASSADVEVELGIEATAPAPPEDGWIAFGSTRTDVIEVFLVESDGTGERQLTSFEEWALEWVWAPSGTEITAIVDGNVYAVPVTGGAPELVAELGSTFIHDPAWAPDGHALVYTRYMGTDLGTGEEVGELFLLPADGGAPVQLTDAGYSSYRSGWGPESRRIAFRRTASTDSVTGIYIHDLDSGESTQITEGAAQTGVPVWSPDGTRLAFSAGTTTYDEEREMWVNRFELYTLSPDGSDLVQLTDFGEASLGAPEWSPDGEMLAFRANIEGDNYVYVINSDGSGLVRLAGPGVMSPVWSPEGDRIAYRTIGESVDRLFLMNADGSGATALTEGEARSPVLWSPVPQP